MTIFTLIFILTFSKQRNVPTKVFFFVFIQVEVTTGVTVNKYFLKPNKFLLTKYEQGKVTREFCFHTLHTCLKIEQITLILFLSGTRGFSFRTRLLMQTLVGRLKHAAGNMSKGEICVCIYRIEIQRFWNGFPRLRLGRPSISRLTKRQIVGGGGFRMFH